MRMFLAFLFAGLLAMPAHAQPWYARGDFNGFGLDNPLVDSGDGVHYTGTISGLFPDFKHEYKIANEDFSISVPGNNGAVKTDANGEIDFHFWDQTTWADGWSPNDRRRVGWEDPGTFDWEIVGSFNNWPGTNDPNFALTDMGGGLHTGQFTFDAGFYEYKFRHQNAVNPWDISIGNGDFSNSGANNVFAVLSDGDVWNFELDLPNGRWRAFTEAVPPGQPGDYNGNTMVDAADYTVWRDTLGQTGAGLAADGNDNGEIDAGDYEVWKTNFGAGTGPEPWYVRGDFDGDMNDDGLIHQLADPDADGHFTTTISGLTAGQGYSYKVARDDFSEFEPVQNTITFADASGEITVHFYDDAEPNDGWQPDKRRVGYDDTGVIAWELMGEVNDPDWTGGAQWFLTDVGSGLHRLEDVSLTAGTYQIKFRQQDNWDVNIGADFGNHAPNGIVTIPSDGLWDFELDLPGGRWRAVAASGSGSSVVPEPSAAVLALVGFLMACALRRRK